MDIIIIITQIILNFSFYLFIKQTIEDMMQKNSKSCTFRLLIFF